MSIPVHYKGREQSYIKHILLQGYLEKLFMILGRTQSTISYVDCFAGPWEEKSEDLSDTSIAISLGIMRKCREGLRKTFQRDVKFRAFFIENNPDSYRKLEQYLSKHQEEGISSHAEFGDFLNLRDAILDWAGQSFTFFFIDPTGYEDIQIDHLRPLLRRPHSEYLINFMYDFIVRFCETPELADKMKGMFGGHPDLQGLSPQEKQDRLLSAYFENARADVGSDSYFGRVNVMDPCSDRTKYHLIYITRHHLGLIKFLETSEKVERIQRGVRIQAKQDRRVGRTGQGELFEASDVVPVDQKGEDRDNRAIESAKEYWLKALSKMPRKFSVLDEARILDDKGWFIGDIQAAFKELESEGKVKNLDAKKARPKNAVNFSRNERLMRL